MDTAGLSPATSTTSSFTEPSALIHTAPPRVPTTGRRIIADISHTPAVEQALSSPPTRDARPVLTPTHAAPSAPLTSEQALHSVLSPAHITLVEKEVAALILSRLGMARGKEALHACAAGRGTAMLNHIHERGAAVSHGDLRKKCQYVNTYS
ncbi:MAG: hypothetical protein SGPRY_002297 [Prymnesium sp.]